MFKTVCTFICVLQWFLDIIYLNYVTDADWKQEYITCQSYEIKTLIQFIKKFDFVDVLKISQSTFPQSSGWAAAAWRCPQPF